MILVQEPSKQRYWGVLRMNSDTLERRAFLARLSGLSAAAAALASCSSASGLFVPKASPPNAGLAGDALMQHLLSTNGILAIRDKGKLVAVRDGMLSDAAFMARVTRPYILRCNTCYGGGSGGDGFSAAYDDLELAGEDSDDADNSFLDFALYSEDDPGFWDGATAFSIDDGPPTYGPTYTLSPWISCAQSEFGNVKAAMLAVAQYIAGMTVAVAQSKGIQAAVRQAAILFETYPEDVGLLGAFISALVAFCSPEVITALLVAAGAGALGITIGLLLQYLWCVTFGA